MNKESKHARDTTRERDSHRLTLMKERTKVMKVGRETEERTQEDVIHSWQIVLGKVDAVDKSLGDLIYDESKHPRLVEVMRKLL